ncbi:hypothetical protein [Streptomyces sp. NBC_00470]|uniref:hypothetical protein n=1 Tax=Streptomyces sp. NBC_00470 TaxID=2975753 RepID=UPI002F90ED8D
MTWTNLLNALPVAGLVFFALLTFLGQLSTDTCLRIQTVITALAGLWAFLSSGDVMLYVSLTFVFAMLTGTSGSNDRREHDTTKS